MLFFPPYKQDNLANAHFNHSQISYVRNFVAEQCGQADRSEANVNHSAYVYHLFTVYPACLYIPF